MLFCVVQNYQQSSCSPQVAGAVSRRIYPAYTTVSSIERIYLADVSPSVAQFSSVSWVLEEDGSSSKHVRIRYE